MKNNSYAYENNNCNVSHITLHKRVCRAGMITSPSFSNSDTKL